MFNEKMNSWQYYHKNAKRVWPKKPFQEDIPLYSSFENPAKSVLIILNSWSL